MEISLELQALIDALRQEVAELRSEVAALRQENAELRQENADLRRQLGKDSNNSSKPPSSDGFKKKPRIAGSLRNASDKKSGGQAGHKGDTLRRTNAPDIVKKHNATTCAHCQARLKASMVTGVEKRQVFDIPKPRLEVTEHQAQIYTCSECLGTTKAAFPEGVVSPVQYGARVKANAVYLNTFHLIPEDRVAEAMQDMFGLNGLCSASIVAWGAAKAEELRPFTDHIASLAAQAPVRHLDETGFRVGGKGQWLHTVSTLALTSYRVTEKRGEIPENLIGGVIVHDHFKPYYGLRHVAHALCNAHHLRELKALIEIEKEPWAKRMFRVLLKANKAVKRASEKGETVLEGRVLRRIMKLYDGLVALGLAFHETQPPLEKRAGTRGKRARRPGHNLAARLRDFKDDVLRFVSNLNVPFTNNQAEQAIRMMKVKMKISGGFRTKTGAETFASLRSVISTARKQGWNILQTLINPAQTLIADLAA
jgi:transposase